MLAQDRLHHTSDQPQPSYEAEWPIARIVSVNGSQAIAVLNRQPIMLGCHAPTSAP